jgi:hypothetical protein
MLKKFVSLAFVLLPFLVVAQPPVKGPLDGKTYTIDVYKEGKKKSFDSDELKFNTGKFKSKLFADWGFTKASKYSITSIDSTSSDSKVYSWTTETVSDIKEKMTWTGTITGENIEGTSEIVNAKGETSYSFNYTGKLKGKPAKK